MLAEQDSMEEKEKSVTEIQKKAPQTWPTALA